MGYLFGNIPQLAGFFIEGGKVNSGTQPTAGGAATGLPDFQAFLEQAVVNKAEPWIMGKENLLFSLAIPMPANEIDLSSNAHIPDIINNVGMRTTGQEKPADQTGVETKERASIDPRILRIVLSNSKDTVKITVSAEALQKLTRKAETPSDPVELKPLGVAKPTDSLDQPEVSKTYTAQSVTPFIPEIPGKAEITAPIETKTLENQGVIEFSPSVLFKAAPEDGKHLIPVTFVNEQSIAGQDIVEVSKLLNILEDYPEPIEIEIADIHEVIAPSTPEKAQAKTLFSFDLRNLVTPEGTIERPIEGVLTISNNVHASKKNTSSVAKPKMIETWPISNQSDKNIPLSGQKNAPIDLVSKWFTSDRAVSQVPVKNHGKKIASIEVTAGFDIEINSAAEVVSAKGSIKPVSNERADNFVYAATSDQDEKPFSNPDVKIDTSSDGQAASEPEVRVSAKMEGIETGLATEVKTLDVETSNIAKLNVAEEPDVATNVEKIKSAILQSLGKRIDTLKIKLRPAHLGEITIKMTYKDDGLSVALKTENREAANQLGRYLPELKSELAGANLKISEISLVSDGKRDGSNQPGSDLSGGSRGHDRQEGGSSKGYADGRATWEDCSDEETPRPAVSNTLRGFVDLKA